MLRYRTAIIGILQTYPYWRMDYLICNKMNVSLNEVWFEGLVALEISSFCAAFN